MGGTISLIELKAAREKNAVKKVCTQHNAVGVCKQQQDHEKVKGGLPFSLLFTCFVSARLENLS